MFAIFCLRLAAGMLTALVLLSPAQVNPRFFRTHCLTALALTAVAAVFLRDVADLWSWTVLGTAMALASLGSMAWMFEGAPGGPSLNGSAAALLLAALAL